MNTRNDPDSEENAAMTQDNERAVLAAKMEAKHEPCPYCGAPAFPPCPGRTRRTNTGPIRRTIRLRSPQHRDMKTRFDNPLIDGFLFKSKQDYWKTVIANSLSRSGHLGYGNQARRRVRAILRAAQDRQDWPVAIRMIRALDRGVIA